MQNSRNSSARDLAAELNARGDLRARLSEEIPQRYSRDMSMYRMQPQLLVEPYSEAALAATIRGAAGADLTVTLRGGGSGTGGAALSRGVVADLRYLAGAEELSYLGEGRVRAGAAVRHDRLQALLREHGRHLPADPSSWQLSRIGGNIGTKASGAHALTEGAVNRYVNSMRIMLADGRVIDTASPQSASSPADTPELRNGLAELQREIRGSPELLRRLRERRDRKVASGYNLQSIIDLPENDGAGMIEQLMCGSVGTLGILLQVTLIGRELPSERMTLLVPVRDRAAACDFALECAEAGAAAVELIDAEALRVLGELGGETGPESPETLLPGGAGAPEKHGRPGLDAGSDRHILYVELRGAETQERRERIMHRARRSRAVIAEEIRAASDAEEQERLWELRKRLLLLIRRAPKPLAPLSVVNDVGVPPQRLPELIDRVTEIFRREELPAPIYGHAASGNLHLRPLFDTSRRDLPDQIRRTAEAVYGEVIRLDGTVTAEHGMGRLRAPFLKAEWGSGIYELFRRTKGIFDPAGVLNPDAMFYRGDLTADTDA